MPSALPICTLWQMQGMLWVLKFLVLWLEHIHVRLMGCELFCDGMIQTEVTPHTLQERKEWAAKT